MLRLAQWPGIATDAAAAGLGEFDAETATLLVEHGRAVLWTGLLDLRGDLSKVTARWPEHADRMTRIRRQLDDSAEPGGDAGETIGQFSIGPADGT